MSFAYDKPIAGTLNEQNLLAFVSDAYLVHGMDVVQHRALPDFRDGLKPVHRRVLWSMYKLGAHHNKGTIKCARVVGEVIGLFHPHSNDAIYEALVNMTQAHSPIPSIFGSGNFGSWNATPAGMRYPECRLTKYADKMLLPPEYLEDGVTFYHPNYDGTTIEPLYLPSLLPNLLFNGTYGIAVGVNSIMPPFHPKGVMHLVKLALSGTKITAKMCAEHLKFNYVYGGHLDSTDSEITTYFREGRGSLKFGVDYTLDTVKRRMVINGITPNFKIERVIKQLENNDDVADIKDLSQGGEIIITIQLKPSVGGNYLRAATDKIYMRLLESQTFITNVTTRETEERARFWSTTIPELIMKWVEYRIDLEKRCQQRRMLDLQTDIDKQNLLILAAQNAMFITKTVRTKGIDPNPVISKQLKISAEETKYILGFTFQQISRLSEDMIRKKIADLTKLYNTAKRWFNRPTQKVLEDVNAVDLAMLLPEPVLVKTKSKIKPVVDDNDDLDPGEDYSEISEYAPNITRRNGRIKLR